jgi:TM2 domain-containing membrane protein YozV
MNCANHPDRERIAYCQNCGKPLCQECMRSVGTAVYCEPCLAAKLAGPPASGPGSYSYSDPVSGVYASGTPVGGSYAYQDPVTGTYATGPIAQRSGPNPMLAALLGFIPGVGAMYNEQYAKGIVHLIVFAVLVSLADSHDIFGLFIAGWVFYMVIEAHHTARARRDGLPLPNPFGLNDLGEKLGFGKAWPSGNPAAAPMPPDPYAASYTPPPNGAPATGTIPPYAPPYNSGAVPPNWGVPPTQPWESYAPPVPPVPLDEKISYPGNRFPAGAIWLIALGVIFLIANAGIFHGFSGRLFTPFFMIGFAVFVFVKKMTSMGGLSNDGTAGYRLRLVRALRGSIWLALVGLLFFLDEFGILSWGHSWPLFIIVAGVMTVLQRASYNSAAATAPLYPQPGYGTPYGYQPAPPMPPAPSTPTSSGTAPGVTTNQEGH